MLAEILKARPKNANGIELEAERFAYSGTPQPAKAVPITRPRPKVIPAASKPKMTCLVPE